MSCMASMLLNSSSSSSGFCIRGCGAADAQADADQHSLTCTIWITAFAKLPGSTGMTMFLFRVFRVTPLQAIRNQSSLAQSML